MTYDESTTVQEALAAWDRGESIWSIEMGGLGPGYEQAIQVLAVEIMRDNLEKPLPEPEDDAAREWGYDTAKRLAHFGFSGAQVGAARHIAFKMLNEGYGKTLTKAKAQEGFEADRFILVSKDFPQVPA